MCRNGPTFLEVGFDFIHTKKAVLANVNLRAEAGVNLEGSLSPACEYVSYKPCGIVP